VSARPSAGLASAAQTAAARTQHQRENGLPARIAGRIVQPVI
jgi:phosphotransferase system HPr-like phosphotransfer protein